MKAARPLLFGSILVVSAGFAQSAFLSGDIPAPASADQSDLAETAQTSTGDASEVSRQQVEIAPEAPETKARTDSGSDLRSAGSWFDSIPLFGSLSSSENTSPVFTDPVQPDTITPAAVRWEWPQSSSSLEALAPAADPVPLQTGDGPRRGSTFLFDVPGIGQVTVSPS